MIEKDKLMILMRGLPGSGKSTLAKELSYIYNAGIFTTDRYWLRPDGLYDFTPANISRAHKWNINQVDLYCQSGKNVIVDNTNVTLGNMEPYLQIAKKYKYLIDFREPKTSWAFDPDLCAEHNQHGVPAETIRRMLEKWYTVTPEFQGRLNNAERI